MVFAVAGSTPGFMVVSVPPVPPPGGVGGVGVGVLFLQERIIATRKSELIFSVRLMKIDIDLF